MHELSLAESILETITEKTRYQNIYRISCIYLRIGHLACVETDSLVWYLTEISSNTPLENAEIKVITIPGKMLCHQCSSSFASDDLYCCCPFCSSTDKSVISGDDLVISHIDVFDNEKP